MNAEVAQKIERRVALLKDHEVAVNYESKWDKETTQYVKLTDRVRGVQLPFTPLEWCHLAMRDGEYYVGGCCGTSAMMQDVISAIFRESGFADADQLLKLAEMAVSHGGYEEFELLDDERFDTWAAEFDQLDPWQKIGVIYNAVEPGLAYERLDAPSDDGDGEAGTIRRLSRTLGVLDYAVLYFAGDDPDGHQAAGLLKQRAAALPLARELVACLEADNTEFSGWAIVAPGTDRPLSTYSGVCIYNTRADAERVVEIWQRSEDGAQPHEIVPVRLSVADGLVVDRQESADDA